MERLIVNKIKLNSDGVLEVHTNIEDNLELAKFVNKSKIEAALNHKNNELHIYFNDDDLFDISELKWRGNVVSFNLQELFEFLKSKHDAETN